MRLETGEYEVVGLDADGCEVTGGNARANKRDAVKGAKLLAKEAEAIAAGMVKVEVRDSAGDCVADFFVGK
jgi:hypothetical protein